MESKNLTTNEREVLKSLVANAKKAGDSGVEFILEDVARETGKTTRKISGTVGSLAKKGMIVCFGEDSYFDGKVTEAGFKEVDNSKKEEKKIVYVAITHRSRVTIYAGTIQELRTNVFGYTLECGNSWNKKISREPKTVASLVSNLNKSVSETQGGCFDRDYFEVATKEQYDVQEAKTSSTKKEIDKDNKEEQPKEKEAKTARKVGDIHPKHLTWIWTEYAKGKFDWRTVKNSVDSAKVVEAEVPKESKAKTSTKKDFLINTEKTLTEEQCKTWWEHFGKEQDIAVINQWSYLMGKIGSCSVSIRNSKTGKSKDFSKHPDWRPLAHYSYSVRGWDGEYIKIEGYCQSWEEIQNSCSSTENMTFYIQKHPHQ